MDYKRWQADQADLANLNAYLFDLSQIKAEELKSLSSDEQLALWLNAYNALTVKVVLEHYPIKGANADFPKDSLRQIENVWESNSTNIAGRVVSLYEIEHGVLRKRFHDPRIHFAVTPAALGSAPLDEQAFTGAQLESQLESKQTAFLADQHNLSFDSEHNLLNVSKIFNWFTLDFAQKSGLKAFPPPSDDQVVSHFVMLNGPQPLVKEMEKESKRGSAHVRFLSYDWSLNAQY